MKRLTAPVVAVLVLGLLVMAVRQLPATHTVSLCTTTTNTYLDRSFSVCTDKTDYDPGDTVQISGSGFAGNATLTVKVTRPDGSVVTGDGTFTPGSDTVTTSNKGDFLYYYILDGVQGHYLIEVLDTFGDVLATHIFTDDTGVPTSISATYGTSTQTLTVSGTYNNAPCTDRRVGFAIFINGSNPVTPGTGSLDGVNTNTMHLVSPNACTTSGSWSDSHTLATAPTSVCVVIYDVHVGDIGDNAGHNNIPAGSNRNGDNSFESQNDADTYPPNSCVTPTIVTTTTTTTTLPPTTTTTTTLPPTTTTTTLPPTTTTTTLPPTTTPTPTTTLPPPTIPTTSEWGLMIFAAALLGFMAWMLSVRRSIR